VTTTDITHTQAIDVHAHYGDYVHPGGGIRNTFMTGDVNVVVQRARRANTRLTIVSSLLALLPRGGADPVAGNERVAGDVDGFEELLFWAVVDPLKPRTYDQAAELLKNPQCAGIKIHPEEHKYPIREHGRKIFEFAEKHRAIVITHSGEENSLPGDFLAFANDFAAVRLILAHLGCGCDNDPGHQVRAVQQSRHGNIFIDTSSASNITSNQIEWAVGQIGADRLLYGTDSPLYFAPMQRARIDHAEISDVDKRKILCENAEQLLHLT